MTSTCYGTFVCHGHCTVTMMYEVVGKNYQVASKKKKGTRMVYNLDLVTENIDSQAEFTYRPLEEFF